jgi:hypothetical protein
VKPGGRKQRENCIRMLTAAGANVNALDMHGYSCLHYAAMLGWHDRYYMPICCTCYYCYVCYTLYISVCTELSCSSLFINHVHVQCACPCVLVNAAEAV